MSIYAVGDVQGCFDALTKLLKHIAFNPQNDEVWFVGDLVNRGEQSLEVLRFIKGLNNSARCVLGNHDIFLLRIAAGLVEPPKDGSLNAVLESPDCAELINWLRHRPLMLLDNTRKLAIIHAGLIPAWNLTTAKSLAEKIERKLQSHNVSEYRAFLAGINSITPDRWQSSMNEETQQYAALNALTRLRYCDKNGTMALAHKEPPGKQPPQLKPWFEWKHYRGNSFTVVIGHWASLGFIRQPGVIAIDTGCVWKQWSGTLTAYRLDHGREKRFSTPC